RSWAEIQAEPRAGSATMRPSAAGWVPRSSGGGAAGRTPGARSGAARPPILAISVPSAKIGLKTAALMIESIPQPVKRHDRPGPVGSMAHDDHQEKAMALPSHVKFVIIGA